MWLRMAVLTVVLNVLGLGEEAYAYELTADTDVNLRTLRVMDLSLYGVKLGDDASAVAELLLGTKTEEPKVEIEGTFFLLLDQHERTAPMAGIRIFKGRVDLMFINNRFSSRCHGVFRQILESQSPTEVEHLLNELSEVPGITIEYQEGGVSMLFSLP